MSFDDVVVAVGKFGRYQRRIYTLLCLPLLSCGLQVMAGVFLAAKPNFRCLLPNESPENASYHLLPDITDIFNPRINKTKDWPQCEKYDVNMTDRLHEFDRNYSLVIPVSKCEHYVYDKTTYQLTTTTEFNLVCDASWLRATADSLFMLGMLTGAIIFGRLSDRYGRRVTLCWILVIQTLIGFLVALSPDITSYLILRLLLASATNGAYLVSYVSAIEMAVPEQRMMVGSGIGVVFSLGYILVSCFAYFVTNWRLLQVAITVPNLVFLVYWWLLPESARWLVITGRLEEAESCVQKACRVNDIKLSKAEFYALLSSCSIEDPNCGKSSALDLLKYPNLRRRSCLLFLSWFIILSTYYGLSWNTSSLVGNDYINFAISGLVEIPSGILVYLTSNKWGRRSVLCSSMIMTGTFLILTTLVPNGMPWLTVVFAMIGKLTITVSYLTVYIFTAELYPTVIRNVGVGACSACARIGGMLAPYINYSSTTWALLPAVLFGCSSLIGGLLILLLPETLGEKLPESMQDGEQFGKKSEKLENSSNL